jgi:hypothetical protein
MKNPCFGRLANRRLEENKLSTGILLSPQRLSSRREQSALSAFLVGSAAIFLATAAAKAEDLTLQSARPVVVKTVPPAGAADVDAGLTEIKVIFSKPMQDGSWSWSTWGEENFPKTTGNPRYLPDGRTCVLPVKLQPGKFYATWLNSDKFHGFQDRDGRAAVPYLLSFVTSETVSGPRATGSGPDALLNDQQRAILAWTDRQFRSFFDLRTFSGWSEKERADLEAKSIDTLNGPRNQDYYQAIGTLAALRSQKAVQPLLAIAADRAEKDCRDRWMAIRALGIIGDKQVVPELIPLVYHGNVNTRWWAQISLVRLTGQNFGSDWREWANWYNTQSGQAPLKPEIIRWWKDQPAPGRLAETLADSDRKFLQDIAPKPTEAEAPSKGKE